MTRGGGGARRTRPGAGQTRIAGFADQRTRRRRFARQRRAAGNRREEKLSQRAAAAQHWGGAGIGWRTELIESLRVDLDAAAGLAADQRLRPGRARQQSTRQQGGQQ